MTFDEHEVRLVALALALLSLIVFAVFISNEYKIFNKSIGKEKPKKKKKLIIDEEKNKEVKE